MKKLFNTPEINYINNHEEPILAFWHLWSVKESAYKAWQRQTKSKPVFNAYTFFCQNIKANPILVVKDDFNCEIKTTFSTHYIYSQCQSEALTSIILKSNFDYSRLKNKWYDEGWQIIKTTQGIPYLYNKQKRIFTAISLSHNNQFTAVNFKKIDELI